MSDTLEYEFVQPALNLSENALFTNKQTSAGSPKPGISRRSAFKLVAAISLLGTMGILLTACGDAGTNSSNGSVTPVDSNSDSGGDNSNSGTNNNNNSSSSNNDNSNDNNDDNNDDSGGDDSGGDDSGGDDSGGDDGD